MDYLIEETNFVNVEENDEVSDSYQCNRYILIFYKLWTIIKQTLVEIVF